jgi:hypothetical protein
MAQAVSFRCLTKDSVRYYHKCTHYLMGCTVHSFQILINDDRHYISTVFLNMCYVIAVVQYGLTVKGTDG